MTHKETEKRNPDDFGIIQMDFDLLGRVLTEYAHSIEHIQERDFIQVEDVEYDEEEKILTTFITLITHTEH